MLSLPPAFVLSQDQTLKFETARCPSCNKQQLIALRIFDEKPCGSDLAIKAFGYSLKKTHTTVVSYGIRLPRHPLEHAPPASLFLSSQCQSAAGTKIPKSILNPTGTKSTRPPSQDTQHNPPNLSAFGKKARSTTAPRPSVTGLIWLQSTKCQAAEIKNFKNLTSA